MKSKTYKLYVITIGAIFLLALSFFIFPVGKAKADTNGPILPEGEWILFNRGLPTTDIGWSYYDIYAVKPDGDQMTRLTFDSEGLDGQYPSYKQGLNTSPNGKFLSWCSIISTPRTYYLEIYDLLTGERSQIELERPCYTAYWTPDSQYILYAQAVGRNPITAIMFKKLDTFSGNIETILTIDHPINTYNFPLSPDGSKMYFFDSYDAVSNTTPLKMYDFSSQEFTTLDSFPKNGYGRSLYLNNDGTMLMFKGNEAPVYYYDLNTGFYEGFYLPNFTTGSGMDWAPDNHRFVLVSDYDGVIINDWEIGHWKAFRQTTITETGVSFGRVEDVTWAYVPSGNEPPFNLTVNAASDEEGIVIISAFAEDPDEDELFYSWDIGENGIIDYYGDTISIDTDGPSIITGKVFVDDGQGEIIDLAFAIPIFNVDPTATLNSYDGVIFEGESVFIYFSDAFDPSTADMEAGLRYAFDCTGSLLDSILYTDSGISENTNCLFDDNGNHFVSGIVIDKDDGSTPQNIEILVENVAPIGTLSTTREKILIGESVSLSFSNQYDPSLADTLSGFLYTFDCEGDSSSEVVNSITSHYTCTYLTEGIYSPVGKIMDKDGGENRYSVQIIVQTPAEAIEDLSDLLNELDIQSGLLTSLDSKLASALNSLDDVNANNDQVAINSLQSFINAVEAQRDKKISSEQADFLISEVLRIIASLQLSS